MSFGPKPPSFDDDEKKYLKFLGATTLLTVLITKTVDVVADEFKGLLQRRREARKKAEEVKPS
jgi:hypothetical protein